MTTLFRIVEDDGPPFPDNISEVGFMSSFPDLELMGE